jgi:hypothetical protein
MRAAQERAMKHARELDVVHEAGTPGEQRRVFDAEHPRAELLRPHFPLLPVLRRRLRFPSLYRF